MIEKWFPLVKVVTTNNDKPWITSKIKTLISERQKAHKSLNFYARDQLAKKIKIEIKKQSTNIMSQKLNPLQMVIVQKSGSTTLEI